MADQQPVAEQLLIGAAGGVIVFALTTIFGVVQRAVQRGKELRGLSRVLWPEMKRNWLAIGSLKVQNYGHRPYRGGYPTREAWLAARVRLSQLMREDDFGTLARYYAEVELLEAAVARDDPVVGSYADKAKDHELRALEVVEGYCDARWQLFEGHGPGPLKDGGWVGTLMVPLNAGAEEDATEDPDGED